MTDFTSEGHKIFSTTPSVWMPLIAPLEKYGLDRVAEYDKGYNMLSLEIQTVGASTVYKFRIDATDNAEYTKLFMMFKGVIWFYREHEILPSGDAATSATLYVSAYKGALNRMIGVFPINIPFAVQYLTYSNFDWDQDPSRDRLKPLLLPIIKRYLSEKFMKRRYKEVTGVEFVETAGTTIADEYYALFLTHAGIAIPANGGDHIAELLNDDQSNTSVYRLDMTCGTILENWNAPDDVVTSFTFWQRMIGPGQERISGHPMIAHLRGINPAASMADTVDHDQATIDKFPDMFGIDPESITAKVVIPARGKSFSRNGVVYPPNDGKVEITIYNPGNAALLVESNDTRVIAVLPAEFVGDGTVSLESQPDVDQSLESFISIYSLRNSSRVFLFKIDICVLEPVAVPLGFFKLQDPVTLKTADDTNIQSIVARAAEIIGAQACVYLYSKFVNDEGKPVVVELQHPDAVGDSITDGEIKALHDPFTAELARDPETLKLWCGLVWKFDLTSSSDGDRLGVTGLFDLWSYPSIFMEDAGGDVGRVLAHEFCHAVSQNAWVSPANVVTDEDKYKHFAHRTDPVTKTLTDDVTDCGLPHNLMAFNIDEKLPEKYPRLTYQQASLLNLAATKLA